MVTIINTNNNNLHAGETYESFFEAEEVIVKNGGGSCFKEPHWHLRITITPTGWRRTTFIFTNGIFRFFRKEYITR